MKKNITKLVLSIGILGSLITPLKVGKVADKQLSLYKIEFKNESISYYFDRFYLDKNDTVLMYHDIPIYVLNK